MKSIVFSAVLLLVSMVQAQTDIKFLGSKYINYLTESVLIDSSPSTQESLDALEKLTTKSSDRCLSNDFQLNGFESQLIAGVYTNIDGTSVPQTNRKISIDFTCSNFDSRIRFD